MSSALDLAHERLLAPAELNDHHLSNALNAALGPAIDYADLYFQNSRYESWSLEDGIVRDGSFGIEHGVGVRAIAGEKTGFAYADEIQLKALENSAKAAKGIARGGQSGRLQAWRHASAPALYSELDPIPSIPTADKVALLQRLDVLARAKDPRIQQVTVSLAGSYETVMVVASDGTQAADVRPLVRLNVSVIAEQGDRREQGSSGGGGRGDYQMFLQNGLAERYVDEAVAQALVNLEATAAPAGSMTVVLGPGWPGVLLHEAIGHGLEGDFNRRGSSAFAGRIGQRVAAPGCTVVDDGTMAGRRGSLSIDDEGTASQNTTLIEDGILVGYMQDKHNAGLMGTTSTGNGRRESFAHLPMPRMTNTYMLAGEHEPEAIISSVQNGLYAANFGGGQVDITSGQFVFSASEAYLIENGKITRPVKGATLIGSGPDVLTKVSMVGNDLALDSGVGVCGKDGQSVPVGVGQPTLKIDELTVGGTNV